MTEETTVGRNEPCPCGSGKKYKRCCGVSAAPKLTAPNPVHRPGGLDPSQMPGFDPAMMTQFAQAFQKLPKGQLQRLQSVMQRAMAGKDVTREAAELEASLPPDFQEMLKGFQMPEMPGMNAEAGALEVPAEVSMTEEEARKLVAQAAEQGKISSDQAQSLLDAQPVTAKPTETKSGFSKFFKKK